MSALGLGGAKRCQRLDRGSSEGCGFLTGFGDVPRTRETGAIWASCVFAAPGNPP